jgi:hypothetical protein
MKKTKCQSNSECGVALVIAIFSLMLISVVATALVLTAGTQSAIKSNYKSAMHAFYDAKAGLEEARGRLWASNPDAITNCVFQGGPMPVVRVCYIVNPSDGENVDPTNLDPANPYADFEYGDEWGQPVTAAAVQVQRPFITSKSRVANIAGPLYKWVRITPRTNLSAKFDADGKGTTNTALFFDGKNTNSWGTGAQVLTITSLAVTPYGSRRMVQYTVAAGASAAAIPGFPAALTLDGNGVCFAGPGSSTCGVNEIPQGNTNSFRINGNDLDAPAGTPAGVSAIGFTNNSDSSSISAAAVPASNYLSPSGVTAVGAVSVPPVLQTPSSLDALVQSITQSADKVVDGPVTQSDSNNIMPSGMSATNPMAVVVRGDLTINAWHNTGYGLLLVTGQLKYDPDASWDGIILVIGKGVFISNQSGPGQINGAVLVANTRDSSGNLLTNLGPASYSQTAGGSGIHYSSKWIAAVQSAAPYQVLSFREIPQTTP